MKEEELKIKHGSHNEIYRSGNKHKEKANHNNKIVNGVWQDCLCLSSFVLVGEDLLFLLNTSNVHNKSFKWITNWSSYVILDIKNAIQLTTLKTDERISRKCLAKLLSSIASLHKNGFDWQIPHYLSFFELV